MKTSVLIPAKGFANAKQRLARNLSAMDRAVFAESMLRHVLEQVSRARGVQSTYVVTADQAVSNLARSVGAVVIREQSEKGETEAVTFAVAQMKRSGVRSVLILPGDLPLLRTTDVESLLEKASRNLTSFPFAFLTPSRDRMGTNALLLSPPDVITPRFGYDSFCHHLSEAAAKRLQLGVIENDHIALDVDLRSDLEAYLSSVAENQSSRKRFERFAIP